MINGTHPTLRADPYSPGAVLRALNALGWVIPPDEHDAHELLHVMLSSLEEEAIRPKKVSVCVNPMQCNSIKPFHAKQIGCLSDALGDIMNVDRLLPPPRPSSAMLSDFSRSEYDEATGLMRNTRSEAHTPDSPQSTCNDLDDEQPLDDTMLDNMISSSSPMAIPASLRKSRDRDRDRPRTQPNHENGDVSKRNSLTYRSLERLNRGPGRVSIYGEQAQIQIPHPFRGAQSSQMICTGCAYKVRMRGTLSKSQVRTITILIMFLYSDSRWFGTINLIASHYLYLKRRILA